MAQENAPMTMDAMMSPDLSDVHWQRLVAAAVPQDVEVGDYVFRTGEAGYDLIVVESGEIETVRDALRWIGEAVITTVGPGRFAGELGILNGQSAFLSARVTKAGRVHRLSRAALREIMSEDDELCDLILHALWARRESLRTGPGAMTLKFVGTTTSNDFLSLRRFAERLDSSTRPSPSRRATSTRSTRTKSPPKTFPSPMSRASRSPVPPQDSSRSASASATGRSPMRSSTSSWSAAAPPDSPPPSTAPRKD